jgi:preprotein translocase subunit SecB
MEDSNTKPVKVVKQYLNKVVLERYNNKNIENIIPETDVTGDYILEEQENGTFVVKTQVNIECSDKQNKLFKLDIEYEAIIDRGSLTDDELNVFINLEYPPVVLTDARKLIADLTSEMGIIRLTIDPWDFVKQFLAKINQNENLDTYIR